MASGNGGSKPSEEQLRRMAELSSKTLKEGERILPPTRRPDGTLRKPVRIRAGYVPQEEVAVYQSKGALWKETASQNGPPGYDAKPKTKSAKRHERKEKRIQASLEKDMMNLGPSEQEAMSPLKDVGSTPPDSIEGSNPGDMALLSLLIHKRMRALKKKVQLTEAQLQKTASEQLKKMTKLEGWRLELKLLEDKAGEATISQ